MCRYLFPWKIVRFAAQLFGRLVNVFRINRFLKCGWIPQEIDEKNCSINYCYQSYQRDILAYPLQETTSILTTDLVVIGWKFHPTCQSAVWIIMQKLKTPKSQQLFLCICSILVSSTHCLFNSSQGNTLWAGRGSENLEGGMGGG